MFVTKTVEANGLVRALARLTGESMTTAVTVALHDRLPRKRARREAATDLPARLAGRLRSACDTRQVNRAEWDAASGDEA